MNGAALRLAAVLALCSTVLCLSGCWDRTEVNDAAIILATGIDHVDSRHVRISAQIYVPENEGPAGLTGTTQPGKNQTLVASAEGITLADAVAHLQERISRKLFWGHNDIFVLGEKRARAGIAEDMTFILRYGKMRERANFYVAEGEAIEVMRLAPRLERSSMEAIRELSKTQVSTAVNLKQIMESLAETPDRTFFVPYIKSGRKLSLNDNVRNPTVSYFKGTAVFHREKMVGSVDNRLTRGVFWMTDRIKSSTLTFSPGSLPGEVSVSLMCSRSALHPSIRPDGTWRIRLSIVAAGEIIQNSTALDVMKPGDLSLIANGAKAEIARDVKAALNEVQTGMKSDIFGVGEAFRRKYPKQWSRAKSRWEALFPQVEIVPDITVNLLNIGVINENVPMRDGGGGS